LRGLTHDCSKFATQFDVVNNQWNTAVSAAAQNKIRMIREKALTTSADSSIVKEDIRTYVSPSDKALRAHLARTVDSAMQYKDE